MTPRLASPSSVPAPRKLELKYELKIGFFRKKSFFFANLVFTASDASPDYDILQAIPEPYPRQGLHQKL